MHTKTHIQEIRNYNQNLFSGKSNHYTLEELAMAICQVANYDRILGRSYDDLNLHMIQASFMWKDIKTNKLYKLNDPQAPHEHKALLLDESTLAELIDLSEDELDRFKHSNAKFFIHELFQQSFIYHIDKSKLGYEHFKYQEELNRGEIVEKFIATLPTVDSKSRLENIKLSIKAPIGSASDAYLKADLINLIIDDTQDKVALQTVISAIQKLAKAVSVKYAYTGFNPISYVRNVMEKEMLHKLIQPPQNQQIDFLISQAAAIQDIIHERVEIMVQQILEELPEYTNCDEILENPNIITPHDLYSYIEEDLVRLILIEDVIQNQIFNLTKVIIDEQKIEYSLQGIQIKSSAKGMENHIYEHGDSIGVIRPPATLVHNNFDRYSLTFQSDLELVLQAYAAILDLA